MTAGQAPVLVLAFPLLGALAISLAGAGRDRLAHGILLAALAGSCAAALRTLAVVLAGGEAVRYRLGGWPPPLGIELVVDHLGGLVLCVVAGCALLAAVYSFRTVREDHADRVHHYYTLFALFVTGLLGMVATGDAFNLYVLLEITALSSYALLARGRGAAYYATFKYLVMGTIGACFYLLGVGYLYIKTGTLNMADLAAILARAELRDSVSIRVGFALIMLGTWVKMALFPLHGWLPNAYSRCGTATAALVAPLATKVTVYIMVRLMFSVFSVEYVFHTVPWSGAVVHLASAAAVAGSVMALAQRDLRRVLTAIIVAEVGYMVGGAWLGNRAGLTGTVYHIAADALMTLVLFMAVGAIVRGRGTASFAAMRGVFRRMPVTSAAFLVGAASIVGVPPTAGFFSKWYLLRGGIEAGQWGFVAALLFASLAAAVVFFRLIETAVFGDLDALAPAHGDGQGGHGGGHGGEGGHAAPPREEAPAGMLVPLVIAAASLVLLGLFTGRVVDAIVAHALPPGL
jgi:multicomponent Na+:H+ antiporter subunit D